MPELPEIAFLATQLKDVINSKTIKSCITNQEKSLNLKQESFHKLMENQTITDVYAKGKWLKLMFQSNDCLAINLGMGGELYFDLEHQKTNTKILFTDDHYLTISFWWFGHVHYIKNQEHHTMDELGLDLIHEDISVSQFTSFIQSNRGYIKNVLLDQRKIAGIGNYYIHDILFLSKIHPLTKANTLSTTKIKKLYHTIIDTFSLAINQHGSFYEQDIFGKKGHYKADLVAYKEHEPCPVCKTPITKIKTSSTTSYICAKCQR